MLQSFICITLCIVFTLAKTKLSLDTFYLRLVPKKVLIEIETGKIPVNVWV